MAVVTAVDLSLIIYIALTPGCGQFGVGDYRPLSSYLHLSSPLLPSRALYHYLLRRTDDITTHCVYAGGWGIYPDYTRVGDAHTTPACRLANTIG